MKAVLIDDEYYALQGLNMRLVEVGGIDVVGMFTNGRHALENIAALRPDIVFLDIEMPNISGVELFSQIVDLCNDVKIVFTTAYSQYAVAAFELNALDYLIKPIEKDRIIKTLERLESSKPVSLVSATTSISISCFRKLAIIVDGKEVGSSIRKKSEELLAYLICHNGKFVAKEKIMDALWPELDGEKAANNLYTAFYNLKHQELGAFADSIESVRGKMRVRAEKLECDAFEFREYLKLCGKVDERTIELARAAIELYRGMLFEENFYEWAELEQAELDVMYIGLLERTIEYFRENKNINEINYYENKRKQYN